jgi:hypothetical protein
VDNDKVAVTLVVLRMPPSGTTRTLFGQRYEFVLFTEHHNVSEHQEDALLLENNLGRFLSSVTRTSPLSRNKLARYMSVPGCMMLPPRMFLTEEQVAQGDTTPGWEIVQTRTASL